MIDASASLQIVTSCASTVYIRYRPILHLHQIHVCSWLALYSPTDARNVITAVQCTRRTRVFRTVTNTHLATSSSKPHFATMIQYSYHVGGTYCHQQAQQQHTKTANETHFRSVTDGIHLAFSGLPQLGFQQSYSAALTEMSYWDNHLTLLYINGRQTTHEKINIQYTEKFITSVSETIRKPALVKDCVQK